MDAQQIVIVAGSTLVVVHAVQRVAPKIVEWADSDGDADDLDSNLARGFRATVGFVATVLEVIVGRRG